MLDLLKKKVPAQFELGAFPSGIVTFLNPVSYLKARTMPQLFEGFDHVLIDGWLLVSMLGSVGIRTKRYSFDMTSLAPEVFKYAVANNKSVYCIGTTPEAIPAFISTIKKEYAGLNLLGSRHGYFAGKEERRAVLQEIANLNPDIVIVGKGNPLQEQFLVDLKALGWNGCGFTCGGFMHQTTQKLHYYPAWVNKMHLRMPYRMLKEEHFRKRLPDYLRFLYIFNKDANQLKGLSAAPFNVKLADFLRIPYLRNIL